jgi:hypothetical protein
MRQKIRFWLGHANKSVRDECSKLKEDVAFRKKIPEQVGTALNFRLKDSKCSQLHPKRVLVIHCVNDSV